MSKKKTPQEKKEAAYEKDHYTFAWNSPHGFRKTWKKKKSQANKVIRRKSKKLLHEAEKFPREQFSPEEESLTAELFRRGLNRKRLRKVGVVTLREKIGRKKEYKESSFNLKARSQAGRIAGFRRFVSTLLADKEYTEDNLLKLTLTTLTHFQAFLEEESSWIPKLEQWLLSAKKRIEWGRLKKNTKGR